MKTIKTLDYRSPGNQWKFMHPEKGKYGVGPYKGGRIFASPFKDPTTFILSGLVVLATIYGIVSLAPGESFYSRRRRLIKERIRQEFSLPFDYEDDLEEFKDIPVSSNEHLE